MEIKYNGYECTVSYLPSERKYIELFKTVLSYEDKSKYFVRRKLQNDNIKTSVCLYKAKTHTFPTGLLPIAAEALKNARVKCTYTNLVKSIAHIEPNYLDNTRGYQIDFVESMLKYKRGIWQAATSAGKTRCAGEFLKCFPSEHCLFVVPTVDLLHQAAEELEEYLGESVGKVGDGIRDFQRVTVGIVNSLSKQAQAAKGKKHLAKCTIMLIDEVHKAGSSYYQKLSKACINTYYRIGISATAWRGDGSDLLMFGVTGPIRERVTEKDMLAQGYITKFDYYQVSVPDPNYVYDGAIRTPGGVYYDTHNSKPEYASVYKRALAENPTRNKLVVGIARLFLNENYYLPGVIMVESIEQGLIIQELLRLKGIQVPYSHGSSKKKVRKAAITNMQACTVPLTIASRILNEGVSITSIGYIIQAGGGASGSRLIQQVGRALRLHEGKSKAMVVDFNDQESFYLNRQASVRAAEVKKTYGLKPIHIKQLAVLRKQIQNHNQVQAKLAI